MKKIALMISVAVALVACNEHASIQVHIDSTGKKEAADVWDSTKAGLKKVGNRLGEGAKELGDKTKEKLDELTKDSSDKKK